MFWLGLLAGAAAMVALGTLERRSEVLRLSDLSGFWAGGRAILAGADLYDPASWSLTVSILGTQPPDTAVYGYTPWVAIAMVPLALVPLEVAGWLWTLGGIALAVLGMRALFEVRPVPAYARAMIGFALLASQPALTAVMVGQWSFVLVGTVAGAIALKERGRPRGAGVTAVAMLAKPQLFLLAAPALALRDRRAALAGGIVAVVVIAAAWLAFPDGSPRGRSTWRRSA